MAPSIVPLPPATIGDGVEVRASSIEQAGNGLFASRAFARGDFITEYDGREISHTEAQLLRAQGAHTHVRCLSLQHAYVSIWSTHDGAVRSGGRNA